MAANDFEVKPDLYCRFLDDIFFLWTHGIDKLKEFETFLNSLIPDIEVKFEFNAIEISYLDTIIYHLNNTLQTKVFFKSTDTHQLLHTSSYHPKHTCLGILKSQFIRFKRISSSFSDYNNTCNVLYSYLKHRGYSSLDFRKLKFKIWHDDSTTRTVKSDQSLVIPIIMPHSSIGREIVDDYKKIINDNDRFTKYRKVGAFTISKKFKNILTRSKLGDIKESLNNNIPRTLQMAVKSDGFNRCPSIRCTMCLNHTNSTDSDILISSSSKVRIKIENKLTCTSKNVIYVITCTKCNLQYVHVGETGQAVRDRIQLHKSNIRTNKLTTISKHFNSKGHSISDLSVIPIKTVLNLSERKKQEKSFIKTLKTYFPFGLNYFPLEA